MVRTVLFAGFVGIAASYFVNSEETVLDMSRQATFFGGANDLCCEHSIDCDGTSSSCEGATGAQCPDARSVVISPGNTNECTKFVAGADCTNPGGQLRVCRTDRLCRWDNTLGQCVTNTVAGPIITQVQAECVQTQKCQM
jgi:hypothetical protein